MRASSSICSMILITSGCAFSISSNSNILNGFLLTSDISLPPPMLPSSKPTYPGGAPIKLLTVCRSWYSLMSYLSNFISRFSASNLASSVLPVPVGPRNRKLAIGRFWLPMPEKLMYTRSNTVSTAAS